MPATHTAARGSPEASWWESNVKMQTQSPEDWWMVLGCRAELQFTEHTDIPW